MNENTEPYLHAVVVCVVFAIVVAFIFKHIKTIWKELMNFYYNKILWRTNFTRSEYIVTDNILKKNNKYYMALNVEHRAKFLHRLLDFRSQKNFVGREGLKVTPEMEIIISSAYIQITFGLNEYFLKHYQYIWIYPQEFILSDLKLKGGTAKSGKIALSWKDVLAGNALDNDRINLLYHEFAHALHLELLNGDEFDEHLATHFDSFMTTAKKEFEILKENNQPPFLRKYAEKNDKEFFAVCIENFFEGFEEFNNTMPDTFYHLCYLLNQNPANVNGNYTFKKEDFLNHYDEKISVKSNKFHRYHSWHWSLNILLFGCLGGWIIPVLLSDGSDFFQTEIMLTSYLSFIVLGAIMYFKKLVIGGMMSPNMFFLFLTLGYTSTMVTGIIVVNNLISIDFNKVKCTVYQIESKDQLYQFKINGCSAFYGDMQVSENKIADGYNTSNIKSGEEIWITYYTGILGYHTVDKIYPVNGR